MTEPSRGQQRCMIYRPITGNNLQQTNRRLGPEQEPEAMPFHSNTGTDAPCVTCKTSIPACIPLGTCCTGCTHLDI